VDARLSDEGRSAHRGRRRIAILLASIAAVATFALVPVSAAAETASSADSFVESIGVNTHTLYSDTPYGSRFDEVKQRLTELGVRHIREDLAAERPDQYERLNALSAAGIKATLILGDPGNGPDGLEELVATVKDRLAGAVDAVEGPNEYSTRGGPNWRSDLATYQQNLYAAIKGDPALASLPVIGPSIVHGDQAALGDVSSSLDFGNMHSYPNGETPEANLSSQLAQAALNSGSKPVMATETGYNTAVNSSSELKPVSEEAMATYIPRLFLEYFGRGVTRTYSYELLDESSDPAQADPEAHFGLLRNDLSPKPAFDALRNTIGILSDPGTGFTPEALEYTVGGDQTDLHQVLLQKQDGSFYLALWRAQSVWDTAGHRSIQVPSTPVKLQFERSVNSAQRYMPNVSAAPLDTVPSHGNALSVGVGAQVVILHLEPGEAVGPGRIKFWVSRRSVPAGGRVAINGRLPSQATGHSLPVSIQRWQSQERSWQTVGHGRTSRKGTFHKAIRLSPRRFGRVSRLRVVAQQTKPSRALQVRIRGSASEPHVAVGAAAVVAPEPGPGATS
jgi:hypothetical protein